MRVTYIFCRTVPVLEHCPQMTKCINQLKNVSCSSGCESVSLHLQTVTFNSRVISTRAPGCLLQRQADVHVHQAGRLPKGVGRRPARRLREPHQIAHSERTNQHERWKLVRWQQQPVGCFVHQLQWTQRSFQFLISIETKGKSRRKISFTNLINPLTHPAIEGSASLKTKVLVGGVLFNEFD